MENKNNPYEWWIQADAYGNDEFDDESPIHQRLGDPSPAKRWLSRSLAKTIRLQLYI